MDSLQQQQQSQRFIAPPPPPPPPSQQQQQQQQQPPHMEDPHHLHHLQQQQQQPRPPPHQGGPWYPGQFQFQSSQQAPPPPPHHHQQQSMWGAPPPPPPPPPYNNNGHPSQPQNHYYPPPHPPYSHPHQAYPQTWQNPNQAYHQGWEHSDRGIPHKNEEDWAARARAWAESKSSTENQHPQSQLPPIGRPEEHNLNYHDQYRQAVDTRYTDVHQPAASHQQFSVSSANLNRPPVNHLQESAFTYGPASNDVSDTQKPALSQGNTPPNSSIHQPEVPSSYSSIPGKEGAGVQHEQFQRPPPLPMSVAQEGRNHMQFNVPAPGRSSLEQPHFPYSNRPAEFAPDPCDRPLEFTARFTREHDPYSQGSYTHHDQVGTQGPADPIAASSALHAMTPSGVPGVPYPPIPPVPSGIQFDPSFAGPAMPGHAAAMFGQISGHHFRPNIPNVSASFGLGSGTMLHHGDVNGLSNISERPKKAPVPNWLREEIIKKKAVIASSSQDYPEGNPNNPVDEDDIDRTFANGAREGNRSTDSSRLSEDEDDEDDLEVARTAAINKEIKRVLTEVLLKVTDDLFDEIATNVLREDDHPVEVNHNITPPNREVFSSPPAIPVAKASAKVLIPAKGKETEATDASENSSSGAPGDVLGLASYASDDEDDEESQGSNMPTSRHINAAQHQSSSNKLLESIPEAVDNGNSHDGPSGDHIYREIEHNGSGSTGVRSQTAGNNGSNGNGADEKVNLENYIDPSHFTGSSRDLEDKLKDDVRNIAAANVPIGEKDAAERKVSMPHGVSTKKPMMDDSQERESRSRSHQNDDQEGKINSAEKDFVRGSNKVKEDEKHSHSSDARRHDHRHARKDRDSSKDDRKEKTIDRDGSKERVKDRGSKSEEKAKESDYRKRSKDDGSESENLKKKKVGDKEDSKRKRERTKDEKGDRSKHRDARDSSCHKRRRSPSIDNDSSDGASEDSSQRKGRPTKRSLSPSPTRSRRRQVSRSPHKHSQRRHSPYSSLENTRRRRSRSSSPAHRRR